MALAVGETVVGSGADMENDDYYGVGFKAFRIYIFFQFFLLLFLEYHLMTVFQMSFSPTLLILHCIILRIYDS